MLNQKKCLLKKPTHPKQLEISQIFPSLSDLSIQCGERGTLSFFEKPISAVTGMGTFLLFPVSTNCIL